MRVVGICIKMAIARFTCNCANQSPRTVRRHCQELSASLVKLPQADRLIPPYSFGSNRTTLPQFTLWPWRPKGFCRHCLSIG